MPERRRSKTAPPAGIPGRPAKAQPAPSSSALQRELKRLSAALDAEREGHARRLAAAKRAADRRLAGMVREIALLRHHQARAEALERLLAERDATIAAQAERLARLDETEAREAPPMGEQGSAPALARP